MASRVLTERSRPITKVRQQGVAKDMVKTQEGQFNVIPRTKAYSLPHRNSYSEQPSEADISFLALFPPPRSLNGD